MADALRHVDELENGGVHVGARVRKFVDPEAQHFAHRGRQGTRASSDHWVEIPIERAPHLDRAIGEFGGECTLPHAGFRCTYAIVERLLRAARAGARSGRRKHVAHDRQRDAASVHRARRLLAYSSPLISPRFGAINVSMTSASLSSTCARKIFTASPSNT